ncbi:MAG TPA: amino acid synthesis family protein [Stellaceae bacterium]|jgi:hypothetical protein
MLDIRKIVTIRDVTYSELGYKPAKPIVRAVGMAVFDNPYAGKHHTDLRKLWQAGAEVGERLAPELVKMLDGLPVSYGKGAIVGVAGEMEHGGACCHPMLGKPMRAAVGGGNALIASNVKVAPPGASLDIPIGHKDEAWSFAHFDTITVSIPDSPRPHEILVAIVVADGGRLDNRCGDGPTR